MAGPWERYKPAAPGKPWERYGTDYAGSEDPAVMAEVEAEAAAAAPAPGPSAATQAFQGARGAATPLGGESAGPLYRRLDPLELAGMQGQRSGMGGLADMLMTPLLPVRGAFTQGAQIEYLAGQQPDADVRRRMEIAAGVVKGAENVVGGGMEFMTSPVGAATLGMGALPAGAKAVASGAFAIDMARHAPDSWQKYWEARYKEDAAGQAEAITEGLGNLAFAGLAGKHSFDSARAALNGADNPAVALARALQRSPMEPPPTRRPLPQTADAPAAGPWDRYQAPAELDIARRIQDLRQAVEQPVATVKESLTVEPPPPAAAKAKEQVTEVTKTEAAPLTEAYKSAKVEAPSAPVTITGSNERTGSEMPAERRTRPGLAAQGDRPWDIIDEIEGQVGKLDPSLIREAAREWRPVGAARSLFRKGGVSADKALAAVTHEGNKLGLQADMGMDMLGEAINAAARARQEWRKRNAWERKELDEQGRQLEQFERKALAGERPKAERENVETVEVSQLLAGDEFKVQDHKFTVEKLEVDEDGRMLSLTVKDGDKFGVQTIGPERGVIHIDKATFKPVRRPSTEFLPPDDFDLAPPESVPEQAARLAAEEQARRAKAARAQLEQEAAAPLRGTAGDLGQGDLLAGPQDLFAPPAPALRGTSAVGVRGSAPAAPEAGSSLSGHALGEVGMGGARPTEFAPGGTPTSIKNAVVDQERIARGLPPAMEPLRRTWGSVWDEAMALIDRAPDTQEALILELREKPRAVTDLEDALLLHRQVDLQNEYARHARELAMAYEGREAYPERLQDVERHRALLNETSNRLQEIYDINKAVGTYTARGLAARKMMVNVDYTLAAMELELRAAKEGRPLSDGERQQLQQAHDRIQQLETQFKEAVERADSLAAERASTESVRQMREQAAAAEPVFTPEVKSLAERIVNRLEVEAEAARRRLREKFARTSAGVDPTILYDLSVIGAAKIARGILNKAQFVQSMLDDLGEGVRPYLDAAWDAANGKIDREVGRMAGAKAPDVRQAVRRQDPTQQRQRILEAMERSKAEGVPIEELGDLVRRLALNFVRSGIITRDALIDAVHAELVKLAPDITRRQAMDAISGYGQFRPLDPNQYKAKLRDLKGQMQQVAKLEDIQNRQAPLKTGVERRTPTDEERRLIAQVNEAKRRYGVVSTDPARQLASALDSIKTRLRNQISDLEHQLATRERIVKDRTRTEYDAEATALEARRDALKTQFDAMFPKPGLSMEQRVAMAEKAIERDIAEYERRIGAGDIGPLRGRKAQLRGARLDALRARRDALRDELDALRRAARNDPAAQLADLKARMAARLADYQDRIARGDYTPNSRPEVRMDNEALRIKAQLEIAKANWKRGVELTALRNRALPHRVLGGVREALNLPRTVLSSWDVSAVLRQGGFIALGHPIRAARALAPMFRALASQQRAAMVEQEIMARPNAPLYHRAKLYLAPLETTRLTSMEEAFMSRFASRIPGVGASQRAFVTFLNKLRADSFDAVVDSMQRRGPELNQAELQAVANYINIATGRGDLGRASAAAETLATVLFSPRLVASRFQILGGKPFYAGSGRTRRMVAAEYARFLGGLAVIYGLANLMGASVETDPRSSDFGKLRFGNTRVDPLAGLAQTSVLVSRLAAGQTKALDGTVKPLRGAVPFGQDTSADVAGRFLRSKLSPVVGAGVDVLSGQNVVGEPVTAGESAKRLLMPLSFGEIYEVMRADGVPKGAALGILSLFGWGLQQHDDPAARQMIGRQMRGIRGGSPEDREAVRRQLLEAAREGGGTR